MFDLTTSKLLILGIVALIVIGPKDLPMLLRTLGKYIGMIKRQAAEFRSQFDDAMRDAELQQIKKDVENLGQEAEKAVRDGGQAFESEISASQRDVDQALLDGTPAPAADAHAHDANGLPLLAPAAESPLLPMRTPAEMAAEAAAPKGGA